MLLRPFAVCAVLTLAGCASPPASSPERASAATAQGLSYPPARTVDQVDVYHGERIADPYRWMEDLDSPELARWIGQENRLTESFLADVPNRAAIKARLEALWNYPRYASDRGGLVPVKRGQRYFYSRNDGLQNQYVIYVQDGLDGAERVVLDPNGLSPDGTIALSELAIDDGGTRLAYSLSDGGSDWRTIRVRDVDTGVDADDEVRRAKFTNITWAADGSGYWYARYDEPKDENELKAVNKFHKLYFHRLGTPQRADPLVYERTDQPDWGFGDHDLSDDGRHLIIAPSAGTDVRNRLYYLRVDEPGAKLQPLIDELKATYDFVGSQGDVIYLRTDDGAERYRIIAVDLHRPEPAQWREIVAEADATLDDANLVNGQLILSYLEHARSLVKVHDLDGRHVRDIALPGLGTVVGFGGEIDSTETFFSYADFVTPWSLYRYDAVTGRAAPFKPLTLPFDPAAFETVQVFYPSRDGTRVPMFITARRGTPRDAANPTILYGYGGFNIAVTPTFSANVIGWLEMGGVYASANLRGGGEYGRAWHEAGMKRSKQNVFDDFAAGAEYLIAERWTRPDKLAISGRSNGGLLVAATMQQRPELFGAALPAVGVHDMLRFREFTIGWAWESDYGSVKDPAEYAAIRAYSPLHNLEGGVEYPPTLITTADRDDRVYPAHSFKYAAALQSAYRGRRPMLIRVETRAGHGAGKPTSKIIEEQADIHAFLVKTLGMKAP
jgi:prolyl oligopeptidase